MHSALTAGIPVPALIDEVAAAAATRLGRFDIDLDTDDASDAGWLDVTHAVHLRQRPPLGLAGRPSAPKCSAASCTPPGSSSGPASSTPRRARTPHPHAQPR